MERGITPLYVIAQLVVTLALLAFAFVERDADPAMGGLVAGATMSHWLRESVVIGQTIKRNAETAALEAAS